MVTRITGMFQFSEQCAHARTRAHTHTQTHTRVCVAHTQQLRKVVESLTPKEDLSITTRVARETLLATMFALLRLHKISWYIVVFGNDGMTCNKK